MLYFCWLGFNVAPLHAACGNATSAWRLAVRNARVRLAVLGVAATGNASAIKQQGIQKTALPLSWPMMPMLKLQAVRLSRASLAANACWGWLMSSV